MQLKNFLKNSGKILFDSGTQALLLYKIAHLFFKLHIPIFPMLLRRLNITLTGADIHPGANIGKNVKIIHSVGIVIGKNVIIENYCVIFGGVIIGGKGGHAETDGHPRIQSNTVICSGAIIIGPITVGRNVTVGAGSVVLNSVPDNCLAVGIPANIKKQQHVALNGHGKTD